MRRLRRYIAYQRRSLNQPDPCGTNLTINNVVHRFISEMGSRLGHIEYQEPSDREFSAISARIHFRWPGHIDFIHQWYIITYKCENGCRVVRLCRVLYRDYIGLALCRCKYTYYRRHNEKDFFLCLHEKQRPSAAMPHKKH